MRKPSLLLVTLLIGAAILIACAPSAAPAPTSAPPTSAPPPAVTSAPTQAAPAQPAPSEIVLGAALPLTGGQSREGGFLKKAYEMAVKEVNAGGGIMIKEFNRRSEE